MGMAASQARYLALVARKSNCEYEGQQINQSRLILANQTANLFNQMLGLDVPVPPSTSDFTKTQYSYSNGATEYVIEGWEQLATPEEDYNYVVTRYTNKNEYVGSQKKMHDPQVQFSNGTPASVDQIEAAYKLVTSTKKEYEDALADVKAKKSEAAKITNYANNAIYTGIYKCAFDPDNNAYTVSRTTEETDENGNKIYKDADGNKYEQNTIDGYPVYSTEDAQYAKVDGGYQLITGGQLIFNDAGGNTYYYNKDDDKYYNYMDNSEYTGADPLTPAMYSDDVSKLTPSFNGFTGDPSELTISMVTKDSVFTGYEKLSEEQQQIAKDAVDKLIKEGAVASDVAKDYASVFMDADGNIAFRGDLRNLNGGPSGGNVPYLSVYPTGDGEDSIDTIVNNYDNEIAALESAAFMAQTAYQAAQTAYENLDRPTYIGNCALTLLTDLTEDQKAELAQVVKDMKKADINTAIERCFNNNGDYTGGIYQFKFNGVNYYATFEDLNNSYASGNGINNIDDQVQLSYYNAGYIKVKSEETLKALLETDGSGRFSSVRFEDDSVKYTLNMETNVDDAAYQDAMNQYYYKSAEYDKMIQDINVKTSLIHQEDQQLELRLKQLETEQNALSTEIDAVQKVAKDNVDKSFKTFGG